MTHLDDAGRARMVDVGAKAVTAREAVAEGFNAMSPETLRAIAEERVSKGEVLGTARVAGILAAKRVRGGGGGADIRFPDRPIRSAT